jgi:hypothetical protein
MLTITDKRQSLIEALSKIAARELRNARGVPGNLKGKCELISEAYGSAAVQMDFTAWCRENRDRQFKYPIVQYVKVIDQRLGSEPKEEHANVKDPRIVELKSLAYKLTGLLPANRAVAAVLLNYPMDEIKAALVEYTEDLPGKDAKADMRAFWSEGGAEAIILARRRRNLQGLA